MAQKNPDLQLHYHQEVDGKASEQEIDFLYELSEEVDHNEGMKVSYSVINNIFLSIPIESAFMKELSDIKNTGRVQKDYLKESSNKFDRFLRFCGQFNLDVKDGIGPNSDYVYVFRQKSDTVTLKGGPYDGEKKERPDRSYIEMEIPSNGELSFDKCKYVKDNTNPNVFVYEESV
jgi:hypothetical protein